MLNPKVKFVKGVHELPSTVRADMPVLRRVDNKFLLTRRRFLGNQALAASRILLMCLYPSQ